MTGFHAMTDQELNEWIFKSKGWERLPFPALPEWQRLSNTPGVNGKFIECWYEPVPDYCNDWKWAGELEEDGKFTIAYDLHMETWFVYPPDANTVSDKPIGWNVVLSRAIAEAYAVMTESLGDMTKKDGEQ